MGMGALMGIVFVPIGFGIARLTGVRGLWMVLVALGVGILAGCLVWRIAIGIARGSGATMLAFVQPSGNSTPYERDFSAGLALEQGGDVPGALAWFDEALLGTPGDARLRVALADLCMRQRMHGRAEALYLEARRFSDSRDAELYCTQRVIDLRLGPLNRAPEAFPELRRLIDRFPGTREAAGAGRALARLKAERAPGG